MKKLSTALAAVTATFAMMAEGYQVNTFSAKQEGMGHVGVAMKLGAESQIFNPAGLSFMNKTMEISGAMSAIKATAKANVNGTEYETSNKVSTPMNFSAAFRIYDNLFAGVTLYTPYGSSINWGKSWPGAVLNQSCDLKVFTLQPTVSWRILPKLSIGAGMMISWGSVDLKKGLVPASSMDKLMNLQYEAAMLQYKAAQLAAMVQGTPAPGNAPQPYNYTYGNMPPASVGLKGNSELALGFNIGAMFDITDQWTIGASFRSKMGMKVKAGDASVEYADEMARTVLGSTLDNLNYANFSAKMPCPYVLTFGVAYKPVERLTLAFDAQLNGWGTYKNLDIEFAGLEQYNQHLEKNYSNAMTYHLGAQFAMTERLDLRAGLMVDCSPCNTDLYNPETPGTTKIEPSLGLSFRPLKGLSIDVAFMYVHGVKVKDASCGYDDLLAPAFNAGLQQYDEGVALYNATAAQIGSITGMQIPPYQRADISPLAARQTFTADYLVHAFIPAIGISYSF
ncbi:MAG: outer membrane protein transport protein [Muribaculaceae bacterium]|nr:outer membrane protein transport protein [Muribaculaceae bacterium]